AYDAINHAKANGIHVVLIDTAGRMQTNRNLMDELAKIKRVVKPDLTILTIDSLTGNDAVMQAEEFHKSIGIDAIILTKVDADVKGGSAISVTYVTKKPILFVGVGQKYEDLEEFKPEKFVNMILK
ncbi:MAG: signal recognition particle-docking protein FtsY, partial [Candidatus Bathyarchaeia archaeon]